MHSAGGEYYHLEAVWTTFAEPVSLCRLREESGPAWPRHDWKTPHRRFVWLEELSGGSQTQAHELLQSRRQARTECLTLYEAVLRDPWLADCYRDRIQHND